MATLPSPSDVLEERHPMRRGNRGWSVSCLLALLLFAAPRPASAEEQLLFDFERAELGAGWSAQGRLSAARREAPRFEGAEPGGPAGSAVHVAAEGPAALFTKSGALEHPWPRTRALSFWVYRAEEEALRRPATHLEVQFHEKEGPARFWRLVRLDHTGWKRYQIPLPWTRWAGGRVPAWERVGRLAFWFRDAGDLWIDNVAVESAEEFGAELSAEELAAFAFPDMPAENLRRARRGPALVLSNAPELEPERLAEHLERVAEGVGKELPFLPDSADFAPLLVFATAEEYRRFTPRLAEQLASQGRPPASGGFTTQGIATSSWSEDYGTLRPVFTHEFVHALLSDRLRIDNTGEWLNEGLAVRYQLQFHPQENFAELVRRGLSEAELRTPLQTLASGRPIAADRYWQAATLVGLLVESEKYGSKLPALFEALAKAGSTDLSPHLATILKTDWNTLEADWRRYCEAAYAS